MSAPTLAPARHAFGEALTDRMVGSSWTPDHGWSAPRLEARRPLLLDPAAVGLHYGQSIFEGFKAFHQAGGGIGVFRPADHAARFQRSARRLMMPELPVELFLDAVDQLVAAEAAGVPDDPAVSLYLRPLMFASEPCLALRPARAYQFLLMAFVTGGFFADRPDPMTVWVEREQARSAPGGTGDIKCGGNYAPAYAATERAAAEGCHQVIWLDPVERRWVEEMGGMNVFFVHGEGRGAGARLTTPPRTGTLLPGITRDTLFTLAGRLGLDCAEEPLSVEQWHDGVAGGRISEAFACGTAAGVTPIGAVKDGDGSWPVGSGEPGPVTLALRAALDDVQHGRAEDPADWIRRVDQAPTH